MPLFSLLFSSSHLPSPSKEEKNYHLYPPNSILELPDDRLGEVARARRAPQVPGPPLPLRDHAQRRVLDPLRRRAVPDVPEHHHAREHERRRVGLVLPRNIRGRAVDGLHQGQALRPDVARGGEAEAADEAGAEVGDDVAVEVGHDLFFFFWGGGLGGGWGGRGRGPGEGWLSDLQ